jgi:beta-ureidopropionase / N-carbamoyl-L-amino-acid hydrolase
LTSTAGRTGTRRHPTDEFLVGFSTRFAELAQIGKRPDGAYKRLAWTAEDASARDWFKAQAARLGLTCEVDRNGNLWAWWGASDSSAVATGSHLDTVAGGGAFDGAVGVVAGFVALENLMRLSKGPHRSIAVVAFADEEGTRFGLPTFGSRLMTGQLDPASVKHRQDSSATTLEEALVAASIDPAGLGRDDYRVRNLDVFVEVHIEQGTDLQQCGRPIGLAFSVWPHGRWSLTLTGESNHAGTARVRDRRDPMLVAAAAIESARLVANERDVFATVGKISVEPNNSNSIAEHVRLWLDLRASEDSSLDTVLEEWMGRVREAARAHGVEYELACESISEGIHFDSSLRQQIADCFGRGDVPVLSTAAGHDAAALAHSLKTAMIFVRNLTGVSHARREEASMEDCATASELLAKVLRRLAVDPDRTK